MFADVSSQNIVGYNNHDWLGSSTYFSMVNNFESLDGAPVTIDKLGFKFDNVPVYPGSASAFVAAQGTFPSIQIMKTTDEGYTKAWYVKDTEAGDTYSWRNALGVKYTQSNMPKIDAGQCFWFYDPCSTDPTVNFNGQVVSDVKWTKTIKGAYQLLGNPFPTDINFLDIVFENLNETAPVFTDRTTMTATATEIWIPRKNSEGIDKAWYVKDTADGNTYSWRNQLGAKYADSKLQGFKFPAGQSGWFRPATSATAGITITFNSPITK